MASYGQRRIHLDFHASPAISNLCEEFEEDEFILTLKKSNVDSITIFAKCTNGVCYYPTKIGKIHPGLKFDLMGKMIEACRKENISTIIYLSAMWDDYAASEHQEWAQITKDNKVGGRHPLQADTWKEVCLNTPYLEYFLSLLEEIIENYRMDGFFIDMVKQDLKYNIGCICNNCLKSMKELSLDPYNDLDIKKHSKIVEFNFIEKVSNLVRKKMTAPILLYNCRNNLKIDKNFSIRTELPLISHIEIESLPTQLNNNDIVPMWGYNYFQKVIRFLNTLDVNVAVMTGIFHKGWGDFGSIKNKAALEYECFRALANGATICIGDEFHPKGVLEKEKYIRIGEVYKKVEEKEKWCKEAKPVKEIGVIFSEEIETGLDMSNLNTDDGVLRILLEGKRQFQFLDRDNDLDDYKLIILPDKIQIDSDFLIKIKKYLRKGGRLILSGSSGIDIENKKFLIDEVGLDFEGILEWQVPYIKLEEKIKNDIEDIKYVIYDGGFKIKAKSPSVDILAKFWEPYFNRTYEHYYSHAQTPDAKESQYPAIIKNKNLIYVAFPIFESYRKHAMLTYKKIINNCIDILLLEPLLKSNLPSTVEINIMEQKDRYIIHILNYLPIMRGIGIEVIEDVLPLYNKEIFFKYDFIPGKVYSAPDKEKMKYSIEGNYLRICIPEVPGHKMIVVEK